MSDTPDSTKPLRISPSRLAQWLLIAVLVIGYPILAHYSSSSAFVATMPELSAIIALLPALGLMLWVAYSAGRCYRALLLGNLLGGLLWVTWPFLVRNFDWIYFIQHAATNLGLACFFGLTLARKAKPLVTRMAETVFGTLSPAMARYTRQVTVAWTLFFAGTALISTLLFLFASIEAWSLFANLLSLPLLVLMFTVEYQLRLRLVPSERHSPLDSLRAYRKVAGTTAPVAADSPK